MNYDTDSKSSQDSIRLWKLRRLRTSCDFAVAELEVARLYPEKIQKSHPTSISLCHSRKVSPRSWPFTSSCHHRMSWVRWVRWMRWVRCWEMLGEFNECSTCLTALTTLPWVEVRQLWLGFDLFPGTKCATRIHKIHGVWQSAMWLGLYQLTIQLYNTYIYTSICIHLHQFAIFIRVFYRL